MKRLFLMLLMVLMLAPLLVGCAGVGLKAPGDMSVKDKFGFYKGKVADAKLVSIRIKEVKATIVVMKRWPNNHSTWTPEMLTEYDALLVKLEWLLRARLSLSEKDELDKILGDRDVTLWLEGKGVDKGLARFRTTGEGKEPTIVRM